MSSAALVPHPHPPPHELHWFERGLWQRPRVLRSWDDIGEEDGRKVSWTELFFDLIFVAAIAQLGEALRGEADDTTASHLPLGRYVLTFIAMLDIWYRLNMYATRFNTDDVFHKLFMAAYMFIVIVASMHVVEATSTSTRSATAFCTAATLAHVLLAATYARVAWHLPGVARRFSLHKIVSALVMAGIWLLATLSPSARVAAFVAAAVVNVLSPVVYLALGIESLLPLHLEHFAERYGVFVMLVLGESVTGITIDPSVYDTHEWRFYLAAFFGFAMALAFKLLYFDVDAQSEDTHAIRVDKWRGMLWIVMQKVLSIGIAVSAAGISLLCRGRLEELSSDQDTRAHYLAAGGFSTTIASLLVMHKCHHTPYPLHSIQGCTKKLGERLETIRGWQTWAQMVVVAVSAPLPLVGLPTLGFLGVLVSCVLLLVCLNLLDKYVVLQAHMNARHAVPVAAGVGFGDD